MNMQKRLAQLGLCVARVAAEPEEQSWANKPKTITVGGIVWDYFCDMYVVDSLFGGGAVVYEHKQIMRIFFYRDHAHYSFDVRTDPHTWEGIYSSASQHTANQRVGLKELLVAAKEDHKLARLIQQHSRNS
jgi:hypothetical protein